MVMGHLTEMKLLWLIAAAPFQLPGAGASLVMNCCLAEGAKESAVAPLQ